MAVCKRCGNENGKDSMFCGVCGEKMELIPQAPKKGDKKVLVLSISLVVVTMILVAVLAFIFGVKYVGKEAVVPASEETAETEAEIVVEAETEVPADIPKKPDTEIVVEVETEVPADIPKKPDTEIYVEPAEPVKPIKTLDVYTASDIIKNVYVERALSGAVSSPQYKTYFDETFGFSIAYPTHFINVNSLDGVLRKEFTSADGSAVFRINAGYNRGNVTPAELNSRFCALYGGEVTYHPVENSWFAISIVEGDNCRYAFYRVKNGKVYGFEFHVDTANLDIYRNYIETIYDTLK